MPIAKKSKNSRVRWVSHGEMKSIVEKRAQSVLKVSRATFMRNRKNGEYAKLDADDCPGIVELALLAPSVENAKTRARKNR
jgi:hypothetical protein